MDNLPLLNNIIDCIIIDNSDNHKHLADLRECIYILIEEYLENNIHLYKLHNFTSIVIDGVYDYFLELYPYDLLNIDIQYVIEETLHMYFIVNNCPRSYKNTHIIKKINVTNYNLYKLLI